MRFFKSKTNIDFIKNKRKMFIISAVVILVGVVSLIINKGPKYSIDFLGGVSVQVNLTPLEDGYVKLTVADLRTAFEGTDFEAAQVQSIKNLNDDRSIFVINSKIFDQSVADGVEKQIEEILSKSFPNHTKSEDLIRYTEKVGPKVGAELKTKALWAVFYSLLGIIIYIWWRFEFIFGVAAVIALFHDVVITVGIFSIAGMEISLSIVAALLTIVGYSLNDTIVVFDRIREDKKVYRRESFTSQVNKSINETLSRTIITSLTTFFVVLFLYLFGGEVIKNFAFALMIGVVVGTYSSIFIASPLLVEYQDRKLKNRR